MRLWQSLCFGILGFLLVSVTSAGELYDATLAGKKDEVARLLAAGSDIHDRGELGTPLHAAAAEGNLSLIVLLLDQGADIESAVHPEGERPLHVAVEYKQLAVVALLLQRKASISARPNNDRTPLHIAARVGATEIATLLLERGADPNAATGKHKFRPLHYAAWWDRFEIAKLLLAHRADIDPVADSYTPLLAASEKASPELIELLLTHGANVDVRSNEGMTPLMLARSSIHKGSADVLLRHGAK